MVVFQFPFSRLRARCIKKKKTLLTFAHSITLVNKICHLFFSTSLPFCTFWRITSQSMGRVVGEGKEIFFLPPYLIWVGSRLLCSYATARASSASMLLCAFSSTFTSRDWRFILPLLTMSRRSPESFLGCLFNRTCDNGKYLHGSLGKILSPVFETTFFVVDEDVQL